MKGDQLKPMKGDRPKSMTVWEVVEALFNMEIDWFEIDWAAVQEIDQIDRVFEQVELNEKGIGSSQ